MGVFGRKFLALSQLRNESDSFALLSDSIVFAEVFGKGSLGSCSWCTVSSWRKSRCPGSAACCGGLEERRCGRDQQGDDMADLMTDSFRRTKMLQLKHLEPQARIQCPCVLANRLYCTSCTLWVCILCTEQVERAVKREEEVAVELEGFLHVDRVLCIVVAPQGPAPLVLRTRPSVSWVDGHERSFFFSLLIWLSLLLSGTRCTTIWCHVLGSEFENRCPAKCLYLREPSNASVAEIRLRWWIWSTSPVNFFSESSLLVDLLWTFTNSSIIHLIHGVYSF